MKSPSSKWLSLLLRVAFIGLVITLNIPAAAQDRPQPTTFTAPAPSVRSMAEMVQDDIARPSPPVGVIPFRPTMDPAEYKARKALAVVGGAPRPARPLATAPLAPPTLTGDNCFGVDQQQNAGGDFPPDADGAVGTTQYIHVVNTRILVWGRTFGSATGCPDPLVNVSLAAFFNYFAQGLFDPRVLFDPAFNRWVVAAEAFPEPSGTVQRQFVAVSRTADIRDGFFIYGFNMTPLVSGGFWDFPQLGMDGDTIILTGNVFFGQTNSGSTTAFLAKRSMYSGLPATGCSFSAVQLNVLNVGTFAPPLVLDLNSSTFTVAAPAGPANFLRLVEWMRSDPDISCPTFLGFTDIPVDPYGIPPRARQPGTTEVIDTADNRFQNRSTQVGNALWQVHTIGPAIGPGSPTPRFYKINTLTRTIDQVGVFFATATSDDFNPAIAANASNDIFVTWSSTDAINGTNPQVLFGGKQDLDSSILGGVVTTSQVPLIRNFDPNFGSQRWGDYSAVSIDPLNPSLAWSVNELVTCANIGFCEGNEWIVLFYTASNP